MNGYELIEKCCEVMGYPLSHEQKILVSGAVFVLANEAIRKEREACAKICDDWPNGCDDICSIGAAIRRRGRK